MTRTRYLYPEDLPPEYRRICTSVRMRMFGIAYGLVMVALGVTGIIIAANTASCTCSWLATLSLLSVSPFIASTTDAG